MTKIKIGKRLIGEEEQAFIIVEIARTYNNDLKTAEKMINIAADAGVDAVKIQSIRASELMVYNEHTKDCYEMLKTLERSFEEHQLLMGMAEDAGIEFLSTPESLGMVDLLEKVRVRAYKIASFNLIYHDLLRYVASKAKPIILSTGMGTLEEIEKAVEVIKSSGNEEIILLHCVSLYPTKPEDANLRLIQILRQKFNLLTGYSDHTIGITAPIVAITLGAKVIEKHFTLDRNQKGADHKVSVDPKQLQNMVKAIRIGEKMLGSGIKTLSEEEEAMRKVKRRKLVLSADLAKGTQITRDMLKAKQIKKPKGIEPQFMDQIIGKKLKNDLRKNEPVTWDKVRLKNDLNIR